MARNEEKQQGRLNRLWLQKERDEGRLKDVHERRPKLASLTTTSSVTKWIPSIKKDIEYYLQQSQLSHYPERKIAEFELQIKALESEYKRFIAKLRVLDPSCKHTPWTPRAYCKRRADTDDPENTVKSPRPSSLHDGSHQWRDGGHESSVPERCLVSFKNTCPAGTALLPPSDQNQPLSFNRTRLAVAAAAFRGASLQPAAPLTQNLAKLLQAGLPNLSNPPSRHALPSQSGDTKKSHDVKTQRRVEKQEAVDLREREGEAAGRIPLKSSSSKETEERTAHVLGLNCYSSSDDDSDL